MEPLGGITMRPILSLPGQSGYLVPQLGLCSSVPRAVPLEQRGRLGADRVGPDQPVGARMVVQPWSRQVEQPGDQGFEHGRGWASGE